MSNGTKKISVSLPPDLLDWIESRSEVAGMKIPTSRIIAKALSDMRDKEARRK